MRSVAPRRGRVQTISIVVPLRDEEESLPKFFEALDPVLAATGFGVGRRQYVFIDDGSQDQTCGLLERLAGERADVCFGVLSRAFGKEAALTAGLALACGEVTVVMDVDLQDDPKLLPQMVERWRQGYDVIYGVRRQRRHDTRFKRWSASLFYRVFNLLSDTPIPANAGDYRLMDRRVVATLLRVSERQRFMKGLYPWVGFRSCGLEFDRAPRQRGRAAWNARKLFSLALDGITHFSSAPLRIWAYLGFLVFCGTVGYSAVLVILYLRGQIHVDGYTSLMCCVMMLGGLNLLATGVLGEYLARVFHEAKARPTYILDRVEGWLPDLSTPELSARCNGSGGVLVSTVDSAWGRDCRGGGQNGS